MIESYNRDVEMEEFKIEDDIIEVEEGVVEFIRMMLDEDHEILELLR